MKTLDLATIGLPMQIGGAAAFVLAMFLHNWPLVYIGGGVHVVGDTFFFFQMRRQKCI